MLLASQTLPTNNPTSAQGKDKVLISILQKQTLFSGKIPLQQNVLHSESCLEPAAPRTLALEARLCLGWGTEGCTWCAEAPRFCVSRNRGHAISSVTKEETTGGIPDFHLEIQTKVVCNLVSEGAYSLMEISIQERESASIQMKRRNAFCIRVPPITEIAQSPFFWLCFSFPILCFSYWMFLESLSYVMVLINNSNKKSVFSFSKLIVQKCVLSLCWAATASVNQNRRLIAAIVLSSTIHSAFVPTVQHRAPRGHPGCTWAGAPHAGSLPGALPPPARDLGPGTWAFPWVVNCQLQQVIAFYHHNRNMPRTQCAIIRHFSSFFPSA